MNGDQIGLAVFHEDLTVKNEAFFNEISKLMYREVAQMYSACTQIYMYLNQFKKVLENTSRYVKQRIRVHLKDSKSE